MQTTVVKFGGTSLASAEQIRKAAEIVKSNPDRRFVVASAPGKRTPDDIKVTDLLYHCYDAAVAGEDFEAVLSQIEARFDTIIKELPADFDIKPEIEKIREHLNTAPNRDYMASRGEYLNSRIIASYLGFEFIEPTGNIVFREDGTFDAEETNFRLHNALTGVKNAVIPGFYGSLPDGTVHTFSRGGSDVTGSIAARAAGADIYENWTDVSGMLAADPRVVENPRVIDYITYQELRELSYMGASVLHEDAVFPVRKAGIPINIRNTNSPEDPGTMIVASMPRILHRRVFTGIAGKKGFSSIQVEKSLMNSEVGFGAKLLQILANHGLSFEHCPSGIDTMSVIVSSEDLKPERNAILTEIREQLHPDVVVIEDHLALIAIVGMGMAYSTGVAAKVFGAISDSGVNIRMIDQGSSEINIIVAVSDEDYEKAVKGIYETSFSREI